MAKQISTFGYIVLAFTFALLLGNAVFTGTIAFSAQDLPPGISKSWATIFFIVNLVLSIMVLAYIIIASRKKIQNITKKDIKSGFRLRVDEPNEIEMVERKI